jgi:hypothetical protein
MKNKKKEAIMKKLPIILFIATMLLLVLNFVIKEKYESTKEHTITNKTQRVEEPGVEKHSLEAFNVPPPHTNESPFSLELPPSDCKASKAYPRVSMEKSRENKTPIIDKSIDTSEHHIERSEEVKMKANKKKIEPETGKSLIKLSVSDVRIILSGTLLLFAFLIIIFNKKNDSLQKWAFGVIGSLVGFWLN